MLHKYEYRRRLPHYQPDAKIFFLTFCTQNRWRLPEPARQIVLDVCLRGNGVLFDLLAVVVMPDHVHIALIPSMTTDGSVPIASIMQAIKGTSSHRINRELGHQGMVWQQETFDRALRKEEHMDEKLIYMLENPVRAGLAENPLDYRWLWRKTEAPEKIQLPDCTAKRGN